MDTLEILTTYFPDVNMLIENAKYNMEQDITKYFGKTVMVIYSGFNGYGWNKRFLVNKYNKNFFTLTIQGEKVEFCLDKKDWYFHIVLPENFEKMEEFFQGRLDIPKPVIVR